MFRKIILWSLVFWACTSSLGLAYGMGDLNDGGSQEQHIQGLTIPNFSLPGLDGTDFEFSTVSGKVVIVDFWATWCPPCLEEIPHFIELRRQYGPQGLEVLGISMDEGGPRVVKPFASRMGINYTIVFGNEEAVSLFGGIIGLPTTFIVDRKGKVVERFIGYVDKRTIEESIQKYL